MDPQLCCAWSCESAPRSSSSTGRAQLYAVTPKGPLGTEGRSSARMSRDRKARRACLCPHRVHLGGAKTQREPCTQALHIVKGHSLSAKGLAFCLTEDPLQYFISLFFQVIGSGVSSVFALCLGQTSSFCKAIVFASASVGLQTFNHR